MNELQKAILTLESAGSMKTVSGLKKVIRDALADLYKIRLEENERTTQG